METIFKMTILQIIQSWIVHRKYGVNRRERKDKTETGLYQNIYYQSQMQGDFPPVKNQAGVIGRATFFGHQRYISQRHGKMLVAHRIFEKESHVEQWIPFG